MKHGNRACSNQDSRIKKKRFLLLMFAITFIAFGLFTTIQMLILRNIIEYAAISTHYVVIIVGNWVLTAVLFVLVTNYQIQKHYEEPVQRFAEATRKVANGDFSVYISPTHRMDQLDNIDAMMLDFNKMVEELGSIETLKTDFISNVSHEIKTPIAIIQNYAGILRNPNLTAGQHEEYVTTIEESAIRLSSLIANILKLSRLENSMIQPQMEAYDISRQLCDCALHFEDIWEKKNIEFEAEVEDKAIIHGDENLMELVWNNLISNAIKFTEPGGKVILMQTSTEEEIIVSISDTGCGMDKNNINYIFEKFYQGDTSHATEGNGLGLALVLRVLQILGSTIAVDSKLGEGTTFTVRIPAGYDIPHEDDIE